MADSFEVTEQDGKFTATSLNFPDCLGEGETRDEAIEKMSRKIIYVRDNEPRRFNNVIEKQVKELIARGETPIGVYHGDAAFTRRF